MSVARRFDHDEARALYTTGEFTMAEVAARFGVSESRIWQIVDPEHKRRSQEHSAAWIRKQRKPCLGGCGALVWTHTKGRSGLCPTCYGLSIRTAEHGTESKYSQGCRCEACRAAARIAKRRRREQSRVPCSHGCGTMVDSINRLNPEKSPECRPCSIRRIHAERRAA